jgi:hypothetical protein
LDWQGLPWTVREAYATPYGFEVYRGYSGTGLQPARPHTWILTAPLAQHIRTLINPRDSGQLPFLHSTVYRMRKDMGLVKPFINQVKSPKHRWTKQMLALLGTNMDHVIGEQLGICKSSVHAKRQSLNIPHFERYSPEQLALLGKYSDATVAKMLGVSKSNIKTMRQNKKIAPFNVPHGGVKARKA